MQSSSREHLLEHIRNTLSDTAEAVVPRFFEQLPQAYFASTPDGTVAMHLQAIVGARASGQPLQVVLQSDQGRVWTFIHDTDRTGLLVSLLDQLPEGRTLQDARVFTAADGSLVLDVFRFDGADGPGPETFDWPTLPGSDDTDAQVERIADGWRAQLVAGHVDARTLLSRTARFFAGREIPIRGAQVHTASGRAAVVLTLGEVSLAPETIQRALRRLPWMDQRAIDLALKAAIGLDEAELTIALADLAYHRLSATDPHRFARGRVVGLCLRHRDRLAPGVARLLNRDAAALRASALDFDALTTGIDGDAREAVRAWLTAAASVRATNLDQPGRFGLALRVAPEFFHSGRREGSSPPHAVVFVSARDMMAFHVRFRNIARGGLRVVRTGGPDGHARESERLYDECWGLARAQQLKNKDIPEGGSKGVILAEPGATVDRLVKITGDAIIDLCVGTPGGAQTDRVFLGPDENISVALIDWLVERARSRGYPGPDTFMSSKPGAGINHKAYGVTSEGVVVFLDQALRHVGISPDQAAFTVSMTGGPDGDVGGNALRILHREYGERAVVLGIADGSGTAEDPAGLSWPELLRLVNEDLPIAAFSPAALGEGGTVTPLEAPGGVERRNTLPFRLRADAFLPCGGRPATVHADNWQLLLDGEAAARTPRVRVIVEGANLFVTETARVALDRAGVVVVKDSSANKCGVICSSFEIAAAQLVSPETFLQIKSVFVGEILERLRGLARSEARLLFRARRAQPETPLSELSISLSKTINRVTDAIQTRLSQLLAGSDAAGPGDETHENALLVAERYLPASLRAAVGDGPAALRFPDDYRARLVATALAGDLVYREGPDFLRGLDQAGLASLALRYLDERARIERLCDELTESQLAGRDEMIRLLRLGGARAAIDHS